MVLRVVGNYIDTRVISMVAWAGFAQDPADYDKTALTFSILNQHFIGTKIRCVKKCVMYIC